MKVKNLIILLSVVLLAGCTKEDLSKCAIDVRFRYDMNSEGVDKFATDISKVNLFVFNESGVLVQEYVDAGDRLDGTYRMSLKLDPGVYDFVAWGDMGDDYHHPPLTPGESSIDEGRVSLKTVAGNMHTHHDPIYHGSRVRVQVKEFGNEVLWINKIKLTKSVRVKFHGLPISSSGASRSGSNADRFVCRIVGRNADYCFYALPAENRQVQHFSPEYDFDAATQTLTLDFATMRLFDDNSCQSNLILEYHPTDGSSAITILNVKLTDVIKVQYPTVDFVRDDTFVLPFDYRGDYAFAEFTVTINGWTAGGTNVIGI
ncbi:MAG: FimB/Mfa2 family fimbrial subunit [Rikenellaceae bacterium]|nr:FimB/Mfa2 family fimbrial subunit [Rikenellaceae bacterium]MCL2693046.1 FimB/Mfa2 family fimbrial subunit [Rikenellaceae bacterium]